jgi:hypothetical protein
MKTKSVVSMLILLTVTVPVASAQVILTGTNYVQTFDSLASGLPPGWSVRTNATATALGTVALFTTNTTTWGNTSGQFANYASTVNNGTNLFGGESTAVQTACTNRGPGVRQTLTFGDPGAAFVLQIQDTLGLANFELRRRPEHVEHAKPLEFLDHRLRVRQLSDQLHSRLDQFGSEHLRRYDEDDFIRQRPG